ESLAIEVATPPSSGSGPRRRRGGRPNGRGTDLGAAFGRHPARCRAEEEELVERHHPWRMLPPVRLKVRFRSSSVATPRAITEGLASAKEHVEHESTGQRETRYGHAWP